MGVEEKSIINVLVADDHPVVRSGLRFALGRQKGFRIVAEAGDAEEAVSLVKKHPVDVVLLDVSMPGTSGIKAIERILAARRGVKIVVFSVHSAPALVREAFRAGAAGFVVKDCALAHLVDGIRCVVSGRYYLSPTAGDAFLRTMIGIDESPSNKNASLLSPAQTEMMRLTAKGLPMKAIAERLDIGVQTAYKLRLQTAKTLGLPSPGDLARYAVENGAHWM